jgi:hypothetical protein
MVFASVHKQDTCTEERNHHEAKRLPVLVTDAESQHGLGALQMPPNIAQYYGRGGR